MYKLTRWEKFWLPIQDAWYSNNWFYASKRTANIAQKELEDKLNGIKFSDNFITDWRHIFESALTTIKEKGWWGIECEDCEKYIDGILNSFELNGLKHVLSIKIDNGLHFLDLDINETNLNKLVDLNNIQEKNLRLSIISNEARLKQIALVNASIEEIGRNRAKP